MKYKWTQNETDYKHWWSTECGNTEMICDADWKFCPFCGCELEVK